eukprot:Selendium_serpulae@DN5666_c0_g1_i2.p2
MSNETEREAIPETERERDRATFGLTDGQPSAVASRQPREPSGTDNVSVNVVDDWSVLDSVNVVDDSSVDHCSSVNVVKCESSVNVAICESSVNVAICESFVVDPPLVASPLLLSECRDDALGTEATWAVKMRFLLTRPIETVYNDLQVPGCRPEPLSWIERRQVCWKYILSCEIRFLFPHLPPITEVNGIVKVERRLALQHLRCLADRQPGADVASLGVAHFDASTPTIDTGTAAPTGTPASSRRPPPLPSAMGGEEAQRSFLSFTEECVEDDDDEDAGEALDEEDDAEEEEESSDEAPGDSSSDSSDGEPRADEGHKLLGERELAKLIIGL